MVWKAFWSEIIIVVLGVLIALAANEAVQDWNWQNKVRDGEARLKIDAEEVFSALSETVVVSACVDAQLAESIGSIKAILPETQMYWNALFINWMSGHHRVVAPFAR